MEGAGQRADGGGHGDGRRDHRAGDWTVFFTRPLSATILALAALALFGPKLYQLAMRPKPDHVPGDA
jgi:hypothetical protein